MRTNKPKNPQYSGWMLNIDVSKDTAARVKKKFQCTPYSPTCTYIDWTVVSKNCKITRTSAETRKLVIPNTADYIAT